MPVVPDIAILIAWLLLMFRNPPARRPMVERKSRQGLTKDRLSFNRQNVQPVKRQKTS